MTSKEFTTWLKGFSKAANSYNITPEQWDTILEELNKVQDTLSFPDYSPKPNATSDMPEPIKIWHSTNTNLLLKDKTLLND